MGLFDRLRKSDSHPEAPREPLPPPAMAPAPPESFPPPDAFQTRRIPSPAYDRRDGWRERHVARRALD
jgi:hypothetical protein